MFEFLKNILKRIVGFISEIFTGIPKPHTTKRIGVMLDNIDEVNAGPDIPISRSGGVDWTDNTAAITELSNVFENRVWQINNPGIEFQGIPIQTVNATVRLLDNTFDYKMSKDYDRFNYNAIYCWVNMEYTLELIAPNGAIRSYVLRNTLDCFDNGYYGSNPDGVTGGSPGSGIRGSLSPSRPANAPNDDLWLTDKSFVSLYWVNPDDMQTQWAIDTSVYSETVIGATIVMYLNQNGRLRIVFYE